jgi:hypothetical protein
MTSYMMNGAISAYGRYMSGSAPTGLAYYFKIAQFDSQDALMWETAESDPSGWNDGGTYPYESYNPAGPGRTAPEGAVTRHAFYFSLLSMDGHVEAMATSEYWTMAAPTVSTRNRLYCCPSIPQVTNGGAPG